MGLAYGGRARTTPVRSRLRSVPTVRPAYTRGVDFLVALIPSIGVGILFFIVIRAMVNADRNERAARQRLEEEDARKAAREDG